MRQRGKGQNLQNGESSPPTTATRSPGARREMAYGFNAGQHAHVSGEVCGLEDGLVLPLEVQVHHQGFQLLANDPGFVFHIPAAGTTDPSGHEAPKAKTCGSRQDRLTP